MLRRGAHRLASVLKHGAHRLALKLRREATHACILMLKRDPEVRVLKSSTTIAFGIERDPRILLLMKSAFEIGMRLWLRSAFAIGREVRVCSWTLNRLRSASELKSASEVGMRSSHLTKDARSAFGLKCNSRLA